MLPKSQVAAKHRPASQGRPQVSPPRRYLAHEIYGVEPSAYVGSPPPGVYLPPKPLTTGQLVDRAERQEREVRRLADLAALAERERDELADAIIELRHRLDALNDMDGGEGGR